MSHCLRPIVAAKNAVSAPTTTTVRLAAGASENSTLLRAMRYTPAVTIVAAWMSAETGVGPAMASGSQVYSGICALLPAQPRNRKRQITVTSTEPMANAPGAAAFTETKSSFPRFANSMNIATRKPKSPMRFTMNAFLPASALAFSLNQKPMSRYEQSPTPSHPMNSSG